MADFTSKARLHYVELSPIIDQTLADIAMSIFTTESDTRQKKHVHYYDTKCLSSDSDSIMPSCYTFKSNINYYNVIFC